MKAIPRLLYLAAFVGLAMVAVTAFNEIVQPSMMTILTRAVFIAAAATAPGLVYRRLWPLALVLLPIGCYLLIRTVMPIPALVQGAGEQYHYYVEQLYRGAVAYRTAAFPKMPLWDSPELRLLLVFTIYWLVGTAGFIAVTFRKPLPGIALFLVLVGFSMTVDASARALLPVFLFLVLAACLFVLSRSLDRSTWRLRDAVAGGLVGAVGGALALLLLVAAPSTASAAWYDWRSWDLGAGSVYTFNWLQNYPKLLDPKNNALVMEVESPLPSYWRANALDNFTGTAWVTSQAFTRRLTADSVNGQYEYEIPASDPAPDGTALTEQFSLQKSVSTNYLFIGGDARLLTIGKEVAPRMNEMRSMRVSTPLESSVAYSLEAVIPDVHPADLVGLGSDYPKALAAYLTLPFSRLADLEGSDKEAAWRASLEENTPDGDEWVQLYSLNERIVRDATDPYQIALRIEQYLRRFYSYSLTPPASQYSSPYAAFLFDTHSGYCQHFAGVMALLLRFNGIPARVAVGFATGEESRPGVYTVTTNNAHAWVEAYFPTQGWVAFDPTPGRSLPTPGASSTSPGFVNPFVDETISSGNTTPVTLPPQDLSENQPAGGTTQPQEKSWLSRATWLPWVLGIIVLVGGWPAARSLWRRRDLHRGPYDRRLQASLGLLRGDMRAYGAPVSAALTLEELLDGVGKHVGIEPAAEFVDRTGSILFGGRPARRQDVATAESIRHAVKLRLRRRHGWLRTIFAWYGVPRLSS
jgi:transglutaminase-like putative cysteine protease